ncbi:MAG: reverse transcriptase domain-containing protein [Planctomycetota bacterium]|jgi:hypothetical protein|nr:reverse transcriptase domain-containing protein [Planctomycetota bacterium]MDP6503179.1 reverse transcriptase domain-containing protein [Planctomycetota bacterium]
MTFTRLCSWDNLYKGWRKASKGKRSKSSVAAFEYRLEENLLNLQTSLAIRRWAPGRYVSFTVHDPKKRLISAAPFADRVVHHALCNVVEPVFERSFIADSYANRMERGTHRAVARLQNLARRYPYVLSCDVQKFFPSMDHQVLRALLFKKIVDPAIRWLVDEIIDSGNHIHPASAQPTYFPGDDLLSPLRPKGLPIGNLTSQFWANVYMNPFDHFVKRELCCPGYVRYVDDFHLFGESKSDLWEWQRTLVHRLESFRLQIHEGAHPRPVTEGISFLGFIVYPTHRRVKRRKVVQIRRYLKGMVEQVECGDVPLEALTKSVQSWVNHVRYANTVGLRKNVLNGLKAVPAKG